MAIIPCPECGREISDRAKACIHCGFPIAGGGSLDEGPMTGAQVAPGAATDGSVSQAAPGGGVTQQTTEPATGGLDTSAGILKSKFWDFPEAKIVMGIAILALALSLLSVYSAVRVRRVADVLDETIDLVWDQQADIVLIELSREATQGVVTDDIYVHRAHFYRASDEGAVNAVIDITPQPSFEVNYKGKGKFSLSDREMKAVIKLLVDKVLEFGADEFEWLKTEHGCSIDRGVISITADNFDLAEYSFGMLTMTGE